MTEKRFKVINISKNGMKGLFQLGNDNLSIYDVARLLNELWEENEQLKSENIDLRKDLGEFEKSINIQGLIGENEQLKEENKWLKSIHFASDVLKENKELKQEIETLHEQLAHIGDVFEMTEKRFTIKEFSTLDAMSSLDVICDNGIELPSSTACDLLNELNEENEELKQRNNRQAKQLDRLYNLIEEKDWRTLTDILDDFKRCEEQLQKEWGTYGDVE